MSFALTTRQIRERTKTVTRRRGWQFLRAGDLVQPVVKAQGLRKGDHPAGLGDPIRIVSLRREALDAITDADVAREGFSDMGPEDFAAMFCRHNGGGLDQIVTRIEFAYLPAPPSAQLTLPVDDLDDPRKDTQ